MGSEVPRRKAVDAPIETPPNRVADEQRITGLAYLAWPVAVYEAIAPRADATHWYRLHLKQALWFGNLAALAGFLALVWPLLLSFFIADPLGVIWAYALAMLIDIALFVLWLVLALRYSRRAGRGEFFQIAWLSRFTGTTTKMP